MCRLVLWSVAFLTLRTVRSICSKFMASMMLLLFSGLVLLVSKFTLPTVTMIKKRFHATEHFDFNLSRKGNRRIIYG